MIKKYLIAAGVVVLAFIALVVVMMVLGKGPDPRSYESLREPRITRLPDQTMLEVRVTGDPALVGGKAFSHLFKTYYQLQRSVVGGLAPVAPRARWPKPITTPRSEWLGIFGLPIPGSIATLPEQDASDGVKAEIATWRYGDVAEILHVGPYSEEGPTIDRLFAFIKARGYVIDGPHEEEYVKGPGMIFQGDPRNYYTIIRYRVKKAR